MYSPLRECKCGTKAYTEEDLELFEVGRRNKYGRANRCKQCSITKTQTYRDNGGDYKIKDSAVRSKYHVTLEEYIENMSISDRCERCGKFTDLVYDHDHNTMKFRGVLCRQCNMGIGLLGDTEESVQQALEYFKKVKGR